MAKLKVSELQATTQINLNDTLYIVQNGVSKQANVSTFFANTLGSPQIASVTNYSLLSRDQDKHLYFTNGTDVTLSIPNNTEISWPIGTTIKVVAKTTNQSNVIVSPNVGVSLYLAGNSTSTSRKITPYGVATLLNVAANTWFISGNAIV
jgi:hypothetical protein